MFDNSSLATKTATEKWNKKTKREREQEGQKKREREKKRNQNLSGSSTPFLLKMSLNLIINFVWGNDTASHRETYSSRTMKNPKKNNGR